MRARAVAVGPAIERYLLTFQDNTRARRQSLPTIGPLLVCEEQPARAYV